MQTLDDWARRWNIPPQALTELTTVFQNEPPDEPATTSEQQTSRRVERLSGEYRQRLWRNNSGAATDDRTGRVIRFGLGNTSPRINAVFKSPDYVGITTIIVQPHHVGQRMGLFTGLEMKRPGWHLTPGDARGQAQNNFLTVVNNSGGIGRFITDPQNYVDILREYGLV